MAHLMEALRAMIKLNNTLKDKESDFFLLITASLHIARHYNIVEDLFRILIFCMKYILIMWTHFSPNPFLPASRDCCFEGKEKKKGGEWENMKIIQHLVQVSLATKIFHSSCGFCGFIQHHLAESRVMERRKIIKCYPWTME